MLVLWLRLLVLSALRQTDYAWSLAILVIIVPSAYFSIGGVLSMLRPGRDSFFTFPRTIPPFSISETLS